MMQDSRMLFAKAVFFSDFVYDYQTKYAIISMLTVHMHGDYIYYINKHYDLY